MKTIKIKKRYAVRSKETGQFIDGFQCVESIEDAEIYATREDAEHCLDDEVEEVVTINETIYILSENIEIGQSDELK